MKQVSPTEPKEIREIYEQNKSTDDGELLEDVVVDKRINVLKHAIDEMLSWQKTIIQKEIKVGLLHKASRIAGNSLDHWLKNEDADRYQLAKLYAEILSTICITEELAYLTRKLSLRDLDILVARYGLLPKTYEEIGGEVGVTRERIRQILNRIEQRISEKAKNAISVKKTHDTQPLVRIQSALFIGGQQGLDISYDDWAQSLKLSGLLGNWKIRKGSTHDPIELLISVCNLLSQEGVHGFSLPKNLQYAIYLAADEMPGTPAKNLQIIKNLPKKIKREINRHVRFSGGVQARWLSREIGYEIKETKETLLALGFVQAQGDWYILGRIGKQQNLKKNEVLEHSLRKMTQYCGPLSVKNICVGIRHAVSRTRYPVPPPDVMSEILKRRGYTFEEGLCYWNGIVDEDLSRGEEIIFECMNKNGVVIHHAEIAQAFFDSELSFPSVHATLNRSPLIEKIEQGLYKLRGMAVSIDNVERAKNASERVPVDLAVNFDKTGKIKVLASLGILAVGTGVLFSDSLPNLSGEWKCVIDGNKFDDVIITENEIRRLVSPFEHLQCKLGDRICFSFDTWSRIVSLEKVQNVKN